MLKRHRHFFSVPSFAKLNRVPENDGGGEGDPGDAGDKKGGAGDGKGDEGKSGEKDADPNDDRVSRADHERAVADMHKFKKEAEKARQEKKEAAEARMKDQNQWKEIAEAKENEAKEARAEAEQIKISYLGEKKFNAVRSKCEALGIRPEAISDLEALDLADIAVETTSTGKINILGADKFATRLKATKPHWLSDKAAPKVNTNGQRVLDTGDAITARDLLKLETEAKKSGDSSKYHEAFKKFQQQRLAGNRR